MSEKAKKMYAIYHDADTGAVWARQSNYKLSDCTGVDRLCTVAAHDAVEAFDVFLLSHGVDRNFQNKQK